MHFDGWSLWRAVSCVKKKAAKIRDDMPMIFDGVRQSASGLNNPSFCLRECLMQNSLVKEDRRRRKGFRWIHWQDCLLPDLSEDQIYVPDSDTALAFPSY
jgi:hypothetical protein